MVTPTVPFPSHQGNQPRGHHRKSSSTASNISADFQPPKSRMKAGQLRVNPLHSQMAIHLQSGFNLMKAERFEEATDHFQDAKKLKGLGIDRRWGGMQLHTEAPDSIETAKAMIQETARKNMAIDDHGKLSINFSNIGLLIDPETRKAIEQNNPAQAAILKHLAHENALMAAEETIHTYQHMRKNNLSYEPLLGKESSDDGEIDIATTLEQYGVPVTRDFLNRYKGRSENVNHTKVWDLVETPDGEITRILLPQQTARKNKRKGILTSSNLNLLG